MKLAGRVVVITGAAGGIGRAMALRFAREGLAGLVLADVNHPSAAAAESGGLAVSADVSREADVRAVVDAAVTRFGRIDVFCSNAGIYIPGNEACPDQDWDHIWAVNVKAHIYAARAVLPAMLERGEGYLLQTVSAAGLLNQIGSAPYGVTKHAALGFAEWLSIAYGDSGIRVSCICPQGVRTDMLPDSSFLSQGAIDAGEVAEAAVAGIGSEQFLILPHPEVRDYFARKASDYDRWLRGMRRLQSRVETMGFL